jgi:hypothetical protein
MGRIEAKLRLLSGLALRRIVLLALACVASCACIIVANGVGAQTTHYIAANGADTNNGTSKATPWLHLPGMATCTSACAAYKPEPGDHFILRGGDSWGNANFPILWTWSGSAGNNIYVGVDKTWYPGASWTRPVFDAGGVAISGGRNLFIYYSYVNHETLDNIEMRGIYWDGATGYGAVGAVSQYATNYLTLENLYIHKWTHGPTGDGTTDGFVAVLGSTLSPFSSGSVIQNSVIENADGNSDAGEATYGWGGSATNNVIHDMPNAFLLGGHGEIGGNLVYNMTISFSGVHENCLEQNGTDGGNYYIHDNVFIGCVAVSILLGPLGGSNTAYVWNNVLYNLSSSNGIILENRYSNWTGYFWNNTIVTNSNQACFRTDGSTYVITINESNNHCITTGSLDSLDASAVITRATNLLQTPTAATAQGYSASSTYAYFPPAGGSTIGAGTNLTSSWPGGYATSDTTYACTVGAGNTVVCPARTALARPSSGAWSVGAYQGLRPAAPTGLTGGVH